MSRHNRQLNRRHRLAIEVPSTCLDNIAIRHGSNTFKATPVQGTGHSVLNLVEAGDFAVKGDVETTFDVNAGPQCYPAPVKGDFDDNPDPAHWFTIQAKRNGVWVCMSQAVRRARDLKERAEKMASSGEQIRIAKPGAKRAVIAFNCD